MTIALGRRRASAVTALVALIVACSESQPRAIRPVAAAGAVSDDWPLHGLTPGETRFSPLDAIDRETVPRLGLAWSYETGSRRGLEATPIVVDGVLYATSTWSRVFALDAATGEELWRYDPGVPGWKARHACCDVVNRGVALWQGRVYVGTLDARLIALDARTGKPLWDVRTAALGEPYTITGAPRVVKGKVIIGNGGADLGVRGYVSAYDAETGALVWRFYTVPGSRQGPHEHPELAAAAETWPEDALWETGLGATAWDSLAFDRDLDLLYVGTGNASVYPREIRSPGGGDNLYVASILALRPDTGELVWHYQTTPGEQWDYTATQHMILADLEIEGRLRQVLMQAPKNGFFYVLDRATGELLSAENYVHVSWASHVDSATGRPVERPEAAWNDTMKTVAPSIVGGHNWHPMSFHPGTGLVYIPAIESTYPFTMDRDFVPRPGRWNMGEDLPALTALGENFATLRFVSCNWTQLLAWDPVRQEKAWAVAHDSGVPGGTLATAGGLVFQGNGEGSFAAYDAGSGKRLWSVELGIAAMAPPVSYRVGDEQYVALLAGVGGSQGGHQTRFTHTNQGRLLAFKLDGEAPMPAVEQRPPGRVAHPRLEVAEAVVARGRDVYADVCMFCHGFAAESSGLHPDLRFASAEVHEQWDSIVRGGARTANGMPSFADLVSAEDARAVQAYVLERAWHEPGVTERLLGWFVENACIPVSWMTD
ncbi:MAG: PQQ-dependent dehydrogenase, methanol/ethanol family [Deltaproteobacteria bacterium]|nr:PQQ-dependent dehydrogenase, methanol/ethanol family [Deltaproteobacteria bacterium]